MQKFLECLKQINKKDIGFNLYFLGLSALSGVLLALSFQKFNIFILAWVGLIPLIHCVLNSKRLYAVMYGFVAGLVFSIMSIYWMFPFLKMNTNSFVDSMAVSSLLWLYVTAYFVIWAVLLNYARKYLQGIKLVLFTAAAWVSLEYVRTYMLTGFPWNLLGYSQSTFYQIIQIADNAGVYGVSFVIVIVNMMLYFYLKHKNKKYLLFSAIVIACLLAYGFARIHKFDDNYGDRILKVGVIQPNIEQYQRWQSGFERVIFDTLRDNAAYFEGKNLDILIYPETVLPVRLEENTQARNFVFQTAHLANLTLIGGNLRENRQLYNTVFVLQNGRVVGRHRKSHLVIFGEFLPFSGTLLPRFLRSLAVLNSQGELARGTELQVFEFDDIALGINVCSENFLPCLTRNLVRQGANVLTHHANNAWFLDMATAYQHFAMNVFRAVETRKNFIVAANTGISGIIAPSGRVMTKTKVGENISFAANVRTNNYKPVYVLIGNLFAQICVVFVILYLIFFGFKSFKSVRHKN